MKLRTLKTSLRTAAPRIQSFASMPAVERLRGSAGVKDREAIRARDCGLCQECKRQGTGKPGAVVDHKTPLWAGGSDDASNKQLLCTDHHDEKTAREAGQRAGR